MGSGETKRRERMKGVAGVLALILGVVLIFRVRSMIKLARSDLDQVNPDLYGFLSMRNSKSFWWTIVPFLVALIVFLVT
jgi:hypothetical protein